MLSIYAHTYCAFAFLSIEKIEKELHAILFSLKKQKQ
jgi:hypothetical protein